MDQDDWIRRADLFRHHDLDVHRAAHRRLFVRSQLADILAAGEEEPLTRDVIERDGRNRRWHRTCRVALCLRVSGRGEPDYDEK